MEKLYINEYFKNTYLSCGKTHDNFLFNDCPELFINEAYKLLSTSSADTHSITIKITHNLEERLQKTLDQCTNSNHRKLISRDLFLSIFMSKLKKLQSNQADSLSSLQNGIDAILSGNFEEAKKYHFDAPMPYDITDIIKEIGKIELNIFLHNTDNKDLQQAINNLVSSREPYSIKIFNTNYQLPTYVNQSGTFIEAPHDYMSINVGNFINVNESDLEML